MQSVSCHDLEYSLLDYNFHITSGFSHSIKCSEHFHLQSLKNENLHGTNSVLNASSFSALTLMVGSFDPQKPVPDMTYNVFGGMLNHLTQLQLQVLNAKWQTLTATNWKFRLLGFSHKDHNKTKLYNVITYLLIDFLETFCHWRIDFWLTFPLVILANPREHYCWLKCHLYQLHNSCLQRSRPPHSHTRRRYVPIETCFYASTNNSTQICHRVIYSVKVQEKLWGCCATTRVRGRVRI